MELNIWENERKKEIKDNEDKQQGARKIINKNINYIRNPNFIA